jgi:hypothetical protein
MDKIKSLLLEQGKQIADEVIAAKIAEYGIDAAKLTDVDAKTIASELLPQATAINGLTVSNGKPASSAPAKRQSRKPGRTKQLKNKVNQDDFNESVVHLAGIAKQEIDVVTETLNQGANAWKEETKSEWKAIILNTPVDAMNEMLEEVKEEAADIAGFRETASNAVAAIFPLRNPLNTI